MAASDRHSVWLTEALDGNERIATLLRALATHGCAVKPGNVRVGPCADMPGFSGGFHPEIGIRLCQENLRSRVHLEDTLTHELVHAFDWCTMDWDLANLRQQACSEIRAGLISGDCRITSELMRGRIPTAFGMKRIEACVKRRAVLSLLGNPVCKGRDEAMDVVNAAYPACSQDRAPFE
ncbi:peptidase M76 [Chytriomyces sp. MP71]|nr:peptidase M76 [Chytriomyces sp. MP71]